MLLIPIVLLVALAEPQARESLAARAADSLASLEAAVEVLASEVAAEAAPLVAISHESQGLAAVCFALGDAAHQAAIILHLCVPLDGGGSSRSHRRGRGMRAALVRAGHALGIATPRSKHFDAHAAEAAGS